MSTTAPQDTAPQEAATGVPDFLAHEEYDETEPQEAATGVPDFLAHEEFDESEPSGTATIGANRTHSSELSNPDPTGETDPSPSYQPTGKEWKERVAAGEVKGYEHPNRGKNENSPTKKKASTYRRKRLGEKDFRVLGVLLLHEFITTKMVGIIRGINTPSARRLMLGLQEMGVVGQEKYDYGPQLWYLTGKGRTALEDAMTIPEAARPLHRKGHFDQTKIRPNLLAAHLTALLMAGRDPIRKFVELPLSTGIDLLQYIIPESYTRSEFTKALPQDDKNGGFSDREARRKAIRDHWGDLRKKWQEKEDTGILIQEHPELWMVTGESTTVVKGTVKQFHPADLILNLFPLGEYPIHIEIETSVKDEKEIRKILGTYFDHNTPETVGMVVYVTHQKKIAERVRTIAQEVYEEFTQMKSKPENEWQEQDVIKIAVLKDAEDNLFSGNIWDL